MYNHDKAYWEKYYKFWDEFVGAWFSSMKSRKNIAEQIAMQFGNASCINLDELPEPYYGKPHEDVDAVFMALLQIVDTSLLSIAATRPNTALALLRRARPAGRPAARIAA